MKKFNIKSFFQGLFKGVRKPATVPKGSTGWDVWSFHPETGIIRKETGTMYVQARNMRTASRHFKKEIEKKTGKKYNLKTPTL